MSDDHDLCGEITICVLNVSGKYCMYCQQKCHFHTVTHHVCDTTSDEYYHHKSTALSSLVSCD